MKAFYACPSPKKKKKKREKGGKNNKRKERGKKSKTEHYRSWFRYAFVVKMNSSPRNVGTPDASILLPSYYTRRAGTRAIGTHKNRSLSKILHACTCKTNTIEEERKRQKVRGNVQPLLYTYLLSYCLL